MFKPALSDDYFYFYESDFNITQSNDANSCDEAMSCFHSDNSFSAMQGKLKSMHDNDV